jgi:hypothetical protein
MPKVTKKSENKEELPIKNSPIKNKEKTKRLTKVDKFLIEINKHTSINIKSLKNIWENLNPPKKEKEKKDFISFSSYLEGELKSFQSGELTEKKKEWVEKNKDKPNLVSPFVEKIEDIFSFLCGEYGISYLCDLQQTQPIFYKKYAKSLKQWITEYNNSFLIVKKARAKKKVNEVTVIKKKKQKEETKEETEEETYEETDQETDKEIDESDDE